MSCFDHYDARKKSCGPILTAVMALVVLSALAAEALAQGTGPAPAGIDEKCSIEASVNRDDSAAAPDPEPGSPNLEEARRRIADAAARGATELDLSQLYLREIPPQVFDLTR